MLKNYINIAIRNLIKHKFYSLLNISGLAVGIACFLLIYLYVSNEIGYDRHIPNADNTYRIYTKGRFGDSNLDIAVVNNAIGPTAKEEYPEVIDYFRFRNFGSEIIKYGDNVLKEQRAIFADSNYFSFWGIDLIKGNPETALVEPNSMIITQDFAEKLFKDEDPINKTVKLAGKYDYKITGIVERAPSNTHFDFRIIMSHSSLDAFHNKTWLNMNVYCYVKLSDGTAPEAIEAKFTDLVIRYVGPELERFMGASIDEFIETGNEIGFFLEPLHDIYLTSLRGDQLDKVSDIKYVYIFTAIAIFILLIACINYMNLSTARSSGRAREVGIRKAVGAHRTQLIRQFIAESVVTTIMAAAAGVILVFFALPLFNEIAGKEFTPTILIKPQTVMILTLIILFVGILSGSYPAFFLSSFNPTAVLQKRLKKSFATTSLRSILVIVQFSTCIFLIIGTLITYSQMRFLNNKDLGFDKDQILVLNNAYMLRESAGTFREEILKFPEFENATISGFIPTSTHRNVTAWWPGDNPANEKTTPVNTFYNDPYFVPTYGIKIVEGRNFDENIASDSMGVLINRAAVKYFGLKDPIGATLGTYKQDDRTSFKVLGVVENFHYANLKNTIGPTVIRNQKNDGLISFRIASNSFETAVKRLEETWNKFLPGQPFEYEFADQSLQAQYETETKVRNIMTVFSFITIFVACLGLFGLAAFTSEQRTKEIGIRKVMGASIGQIILLLSKQFMKLIAISFAIACPVAFIFGNQWLEDFEYRITLNIWIFIVAGGVTFIVSWLTMSYQSIKAAMSNPAISLRTE